MDPTQNSIPEIQTIGREFSVEFFFSKVVFLLNNYEINLFLLPAYEKNEMKEIKIKKELVLDRRLNFLFFELVCPVSPVISCISNF